MYDVARLRGTRSRAGFDSRSGLAPPRLPKEHFVKAFTSGELWGAEFLSERSDVTTLSAERQPLELL